MEPIEFSKRRSKLFRKMAKNSVAIVPSQPVHLRNNDVEYPYRADSDLFYLTGFPEPEAVAVLSKQNGEEKFILFNRERDPVKEIWHGRRAGQEGACSKYNADDAFPVTAIDATLVELIQKSSTVYYAMGANPDFDQRFLLWINELRKKSRSGVHAPFDIVRLDHLLHEMRLRKSAGEVKNMRRAAHVSAGAHAHAMQVCRPGVYEYQIEAALFQYMMHHGCRRMAYPPIVAGGENACILHYTENDTVLKDGDLLLIDAGGEYNHYAADITRTFPVNGRFSKEQRAVYDVVLAAQMAAIAAVKPGNPWNEPHERAVEALTEGLIRLGILKGKLHTLIKEEAYKPFYMHRTGHWLGMDVHDVGEYKNEDAWRVFEPGMVLTVEPGLYLAADQKGVPKKMANIGIRIEDDVLVTTKGCEVLTHEAPKAPDAIEDWMAEVRGTVGG